MIGRRLFMKFFPAAAAIPLAETVKGHDGNDVFVFAQKVHPRFLLQLGFSADLMNKLGLKGNVTPEMVLRLDKRCRDKGLVLLDSVLEMAFPPFPQQDILILRWRHPSYQPIRGCDVIAIDPVEEKDIL